MLVLKCVSFRSFLGTTIATVAVALSGCGGGSVNSSLTSTGPTAPTNLTATAASSSQIGLSWTASTDPAGVSGYKVERCQGANCSNFAQIGTSTTASYSDTGLTPNSSYSYRVRATDAAGNNSAYSNTATASTPAVPPTAPTNLTATDSGPAQINLSWTASTEPGGTISRYSIERCAGANCGNTASNFAQVGTSTTTSFSDTGLLGSSSYSYRVRAEDTSNTFGPYSNTASATTAAPTFTAPSNLTATAVSNTQINLSWTAGTETGGTVTEYLIERCSGNACSSFTQIGTSTATTYSNTGLLGSTSYTYRVRATDGANDSGYSNTNSTITPAPTFTPPSNLTTAASGPAQINLSWTAAAETGGTITQYLIERCSGIACNSFTQVGTSTTTIYHDTGLLGSTSYSYRVRATDGTNFSAYSNTSAATTPAPTFTAPANLTAIAATNTQINLSWTAATETGGTITQYLVERCAGAGCNSFAQVGTSTTNAFSDTGLVASTNYTYRVRATDGTDFSGYSNTASATTTVPTFTAPSNLTTSVIGPAQINLSWTAATESGGTITQYLIERCSGNACSSFAQIGTSTTTAYNSTGLLGSTSYSYRVRATDGTYFSGYSNTGSATTPAPTFVAPSNLTTTAAGPAQINLSWTAATETGGTITRYLIERCSGNACSSFAQVGTSTTTTLSDTGLLGSTSYSYRVRATDGTNNSGYSNTSSTTTPAPTFTAPSSLTAISAGTTQINLSWTAATETGGTITQYLVQRCSGANCGNTPSNFAQVGTSATTSYHDTGLTAATSYSYRVQATDANSNLSSFSNVASATTSSSSNIVVTISPTQTGLTLSQSTTFTAAVQNDVGSAGVSWTMSAGTLSNQTTTSATFTAPGTASVVTVTATSNADMTKSATATIGVTDLTGVFTYHNDLSRDGVNSQEYALTTTNVSTATFGKLFSCTVDGAIYAQPLWVANLSVSGVTHNVIFVATQHDSLYAFDADNNSCMQVWPHLSLIDTAHGGTTGETTVPSGVSGSLVGSGYGDITPEVGVTGTPVIDPGTNTLYVVSKSVNSSHTIFYQRLHAIDLSTGSEKFNGPVVISGSVAGTAPDGNGSTVTFNPQMQNQRPGLALVNGVVYISWASHEDTDPYHGWVMGYAVTGDTLAQASGAIFNSTPDLLSGYSYSRGGIWMSGGAPAADASNNLFLTTGNGNYDGASDFGDSLIKLSTSSGLSLSDWFTPSDQLTMDAQDWDFGSGGAVVLVDLPSAPSGHQHLLVGGGKEGSGNFGEVYVLNRDSLGEFNGSDTQVVQKFSTGNQLFSTAAFWNSTLYITPAGGNLMSYALNTSTGLFNLSPVQTSTSFQFPGATPSISVNGSTTSTGIVWAIDSSQYCTNQSPGCGPAVLHAYNATNIALELWNSTMAAAGRDTAGYAVKFTVPTVANGKVYVGTRGSDSGSGGTGELDVYGLLP
jgi:hypothetical protein